MYCPMLFLHRRNGNTKYTQHDNKRSAQTTGHFFQAARSSEATGTSQGGHCPLDEEIELAHTHTTPIT